MQSRNIAIAGFSSIQTSGTTAGGNGGAGGAGQIVVVTTY